MWQRRFPEAEEEEEENGDIRQVLFPEDEDSDYGSHKKLGRVSPCHLLSGDVQFPDLFQTSNLLFYERFEAYKDYLLGDCKPSEVGEFISEYLERALEPSGWRAVWRTDIFEVLVEVTGVSPSDVKAVVQPCQPFLCEYRMACVTELSVGDLLHATEHKVPLQELYVVFDDSGDYDQTAMAVEHVRFFYQHIWRPWDEEEEDYFDYFTRCAETRLRLHYDILEERIPSELVCEYHAIMDRCLRLYTQFNSLRNALSNSDSDSEPDNLSMVEGMKMDGEMDSLKRKLKLIENPLLRYLFCCQKTPGRYSLKRKGPRPTGGRVVHVVSNSMTMETLTCLTRDRIEPESTDQNQELQFHKDVLEAVNACYDGDLVLICPGHYFIYSQLCIADSVHIEGYGMLDDIIIEKKGKGDKFVECCGPNVKISNVKLIQHSAVEGIVSVLGGKTELETCVFQCDTTGVTVKKSAELVMKYCDLYGAKGAGVEIYPGSNCSLAHNGIHHCRDGILIKDFIDEVHDLPKISLEHNIIHNNEGYAVVLVKPSAVMAATGPDQEDAKADVTEAPVTSNIICEEAMQTEAEDSGKSPPCDPGAVSHAEPFGSDGDNSKPLPEPQSEDCAAPKEPDGNQTIATALTANSRRKSAVHCKRLSAMGITSADHEQLLAQEMFLSVLNNQFKWNGKGDFGTFLF